MNESRPTAADSSTTHAAWTRLEGTYRLSVERAKDVCVLAIELFDLCHLAKTCDVEPAAVLQTLEECLFAVPESDGIVVARRGKRLIAVLPARTLAQAEELASALIAACRKLEIGGKPRRAFPNIGLSHLPRAGDFHLETLVRVAEEGSTVAGFRGGGCTVHTVLYDAIDERVRREVDAEGALFAAPPVRGAAALATLKTSARDTLEAPSTSPADPNSKESEPGAILQERIQEIVARETARALNTQEDTEGVRADVQGNDEAVEDEPSKSPLPAGQGTDTDSLKTLSGAVMERVLTALRSELAVTPMAPPQPSVSAKNPKSSGESAEIQRLQRRISKLIGALEQTEERLAVAEDRREEDSGVASAFRGVQGLTGKERDFQLKKGLMREILEANLALHHAIEARSGKSVSA